jgi:hypothetical protein
MKITVGSYDVLDSGMVFSINNEDVVFEVAETIKVRLEFIDTSENEPNMNASLSNDQEVKFVLTNFKNPLGTELTQPATIGTFQGRKLLLEFRVLGMSNSSNKLIAYTWLLGGAINNG